MASGRIRLPERSIVPTTTGISSMSCGYSSIRHFTSRDDEIWIVRPFLFVWFALMLPLAATLVGEFRADRPLRPCNQPDDRIRQDGADLLVFHAPEQGARSVALDALAAIGWLVILFLVVLLDHVSR